MPRSIFDHAKDISTTKTPWSELSEEDQKSWNIFMVNRILSMNVDYIDLVDIVQMHSNMPPEAIYNFYCHILPKGYRFIPFMKKGGNTGLIKAVAAHYQVSRREAREYIKLLPQDELTKIQDEFEAEPYETTKIKKSK